NLAVLVNLGELVRFHHQVAGVFRHEAHLPRPVPRRGANYNEARKWFLDQIGGMKMKAWKMENGKRKMANGRCLVHSGQSSRAALVRSCNSSSSAYSSA